MKAAESRVYAYKDVRCGILSFLIPIPQSTIYILTLLLIFAYNISATT